MLHVPLAKRQRDVTNFVNFTRPSHITSYLCDPFCPACTSLYIDGVLTGDVDSIERESQQVDDSFMSAQPSRLRHTQKNQKHQKKTPPPHPISRGHVMRTFKRICVYCGSNPGRAEHYADAAKRLGRLLAGRGIGLVFGGGSVGLMGIIADAVLEAGGEAIGVIPEKLQGLELGHKGLTKLHVVGSMHERKMKMAELSDAFIAMPGGFGTFEELFEVTTWTQLRYHAKPIGLLNVSDYYTPLLTFIDHAVEEGFIRGLHRPIISASDDPEVLIERLAAVELPELKQWIERP